MYGRDVERVGTSGLGISGQLMSILEYRVVLGALITTLDGLVVAHVGVSPDDAEVLAAASSLQPDEQPYSNATTRGGVLHVLRSSDMRLLVLTESNVSPEAVENLMMSRMAALEAPFTA